MAAISLVKREASALQEAVVGSLMIALLAQVAIPLHFTPVLLTGQTLGVMLAGLLFGPRGGFFAVLAYLAEGAAGLPVFPGATAGPAVLFGLKGGYYWAFLVQGYLAGCVARWGTLYKAAALMGVVLLQLALGTLWLAFFVGSSAFALGFAPFVFGEALKVALLSLWRHD